MRDWWDDVLWDLKFRQRMWLHNWGWLEWYDWLALIMRGFLLFLCVLVLILAAVKLGEWG